jgi:peptide/nickel transport system substrate-binding protein
MAIRAEPPTLSQKTLASGVGTAYDTTLRAFNATLGLVDAQGMPRPYLAERLPQLDTETWQVFPDGRMETTFVLKPNLVWQDGTALTSEDFTFAWRVYSSPQVGVASASPQNMIEEVTAPDAATVRIRWNRPYRDAGTLAEDAFPPLPRHLLEDVFRQNPEGLASQPFWTRDYVGAGPFRLARWEPGSFIEGTAFEQHSLGKAKIDQIRITFIGDTNAALASLLAGEVHFSTDSSIRFQQGLILRREWGQSGGTVLLRPESFRGAWVQLRPYVVNPSSLLDVRVRRSLAHTVQRQDLNDALFEGQGVMAEAAFIAPTAPYYAEVERGIVRYPFDPRVSEQLMTEAGFRKGSDGVFVHPTEGRAQLEIKTLAATEREMEMAILANGWRQAGFDVAETVLAATQAANNQERATFSGLFTYSTTAGEYALASFTTATISTAETRWIGTNRGGWSNAEFDRVSAAFSSAVAPAERVRAIVQMTRLFSEDLPTIPLLFDLRAYAHPAALRGPQMAPQETPIAWNIHEWVFN